MVSLRRFLLLCIVLLVLPSLAASQLPPPPPPPALQPIYFDDFSSYTPGQPPTSYLIRGASGAAPTVQEVGGTGPAYRRLRFPYVAGQYCNIGIAGR